MVFIFLGRRHFLTLFGAFILLDSELELFDCGIELVKIVIIIFVTLAVKLDLGQRLFLVHSAILTLLFNGSI